MSLRRVANPPNPFHRYTCEWLDVQPLSRLEVFEESARSILSENSSPDIPFQYSVNPYRGCFHGCVYCYARPTHQYLDFGAGSDFERKLVVKTNAPELLRKTLGKRSWGGESINFSGVTDCYQPLEGCYELTKRCLEVCRDYRNPVSIVTKGLLVRRDIQLLQELSRVAAVRVYLSIPFADDTMAKEVEPYAPRPSRRLEAVRALAEAGIEVGVGVAPVIPGLNDDQIPSILEQAKSSGAVSAFMTLLRLPQEVSEVFFARVRAAFPNRSAKIEHTIRRMRNGALNASQFGDRMKGSGEEWKAIEWIFESSCIRLELNRGREEVRERGAKGPRQLELFPPARSGRI